MATIPAVLGVPWRRAVEHAHPGQSSEEDLDLGTAQQNADRELHKGHRICKHRNMHIYMRICT